jgi:indolepyruvate ferredoxin oxidoreductase beta subunit
MIEQQIIISGTGGQGVLFLTRLLAEAAMQEGFDVLTAETHGMAMRGGTVISHVKIGSFKSPVIRRGKADCGLFLTASNLDVHGGFVKPGGAVCVNTDTGADYLHINATELAVECGSQLVANLVLLGYAIQHGSLFCDSEVMEKTIKRVSSPRHLEINLRGFRGGLFFQ